VFNYGVLIQDIITFVVVAALCSSSSSARWRP
jgi:hypothetical protein